MRCYRWHRWPVIALGVARSRVLNVVSPLRQRLIILTALTCAFGVLILGARYGADTDPSAPVFTGGAADGGGIRGEEPTLMNISPVEGWFPRSGVGTTCTERVGVDLIPGYGAILTINGRVIPENELTFYENPNAPPDQRSLSSEGTLNRYTWGPEEDCPNGALLRPRGNVVEACVYRLEQGPAQCQAYGPFEFDAL